MVEYLKAENRILRSKLPSKVICTPTERDRWSLSPHLEQTLKALDLVDAKTKELLPSYHYQKGELVPVDSTWWASNLDNVTTRWNQWKLK